MPSATRDGDKRALDEDAARLAALWSAKGSGKSKDAPSSAISIDYRLIERATHGFDEDKHLIGHGNSCHVLRAEIGGYPVAIKVMNDQEQESEDEKAAAWLDQQVKAEIDLLCRTCHPHINRLLGVSFDGPHRCLVLEYMNGGALDDRLRNKSLSALQWVERARILLHTARGLAYMHSLNPPVIHRDVKCGNVLLHYPDGDTTQQLTAKVSDFGIARVNAEQDDNVLRTSKRTHASTRQVCGTGERTSERQKIAACITHDDFFPSLR